MGFIENQDHRFTFWTERTNGGGQFESQFLFVLATIRVIQIGKDRLQNFF